MSSYFHSAALVASPSYPNSVVWSDENLIAVASGHLVTILNPSKRFGPRGLITIPPNKPFPIGTIHREDLLTGCLLPTCVSRDARPCVRSISWSHLGLAPNSGCLLAVCTTEGRVKLYRAPFCEFCAEWVEVTDISDLLFDYLLSINFEEIDMPSGKSSGNQAPEQYVESGCANDIQKLALSKERKRRKMNTLVQCTSIEALGDQLSSLSHRKDANGSCTPTREKTVTASTEVLEVQFEKSNETKLHQRTLVRKSKKIHLDRTQEMDSLPLLTPRQYASRSAMLSSLVVSWSPVLQSSSEHDSNHPNSSSNNCGLLAVGGKSGKISIWRIHEPDCYSVEHSRVSLHVILVGLLQAHNTWITAISWGVSSNASKSQVLLVTGSSDGSVKIWLGDPKILLDSSEVSCASFSLLKEVIPVIPAPISVLSLNVPKHYVDKMFLAIGRGSGSLEIGILEITNCEFQSAGSFYVHNQVVTGLAWAFDGCCLYSCSQDNSMCCWNLHGSSFHEVPVPSNPFGLGGSTDLPQVSDSCYGLTISPGNLVVAVARGSDPNLLNPMYQLRTQKAAVEIYWTCGQQIGVSPDKYPEFGVEAMSGFSENEMMCWESNIIWSLKQYEDINKPLVLLDVIAALSAFKHSAPKYEANMLVKWFSSWLVGSNLKFSIEEVLLHAQGSLSKVHSRQLHILNIICRRLILSELKADILKSNQHELGKIEGVEDELQNLWIEILVSSERQLRERLVSCTLSAILNPTPSSAIGKYWQPVGVAQIEKWVASNHDRIQHYLKHLASKVGKLERRHRHISVSVEEEEQCGFCSASVPFESPEFGLCAGVNDDSGIKQRHKLARCAVSMQVCPTNPLWFCVCCQRWVSTLPPQTLFTMSEFPSDPISLTDSSSLQLVPSKPFCPFCGILLQRQQPDFLLSPSPV